VSKGLGPGGAERLLVAAASGIDRSRFDIEMAYVLPWKDHLAGELEAAGVRTTCLSQTRRDIRWPWRLRAAMRGCDIVHVHSPVPAVAARLAARTLRPEERPVIVTTEHNTWTSHRRLTRWANRWTSGLDAATFAVTHEAADSLEGAAARRVEVLTHGIDVDSVATRGTRRSEMRNELGLADDEVVIGTVANFRPQKDYPNLLRAARILADDGVAFKIVAVGQGPDEAEITELRDQLDQGDHVNLAGFRPDAIEVMAACDIFVLASAWEGLPVAVMEALALGLPIVGTRVGGLAESLDDSHSVLVPARDSRALADALTALISDPDRRAELGAGARRAAHRYDATSSLDTVTSTYEAVALRHPSSISDSSSESSAAKSSASTRSEPDPAITIRTMTDDHLDAVITLLQASLGWEDDDRYRDLLDWKHRTNPFGASPGWVAMHDDDVIAVRLFMRWRFVRGGKSLSAVRAVDTATHPDFQGRGLFTRLTQTGLDACLDDGVDFVFNTPNAQSRPGYLKMGWRDVGRPPVALRPVSAQALPRIVRSREPAERWSIPIDVGERIDHWLDRVDPDRYAQPTTSSTDRTLRTQLSSDFLQWRYGLEPHHYRVLDDGTSAVITRLRRRGDATELVVADRYGHPSRCDRIAAAAAHDLGATHAIRLGPGNVRGGFLPAPGLGPELTWRALNDTGQPPLPNWDLRLGDIELF
jgi:glycosyltransferase involved in cell wall biosynthesis/GNAT superfamily N-acetyltransferase